METNEKVFMENDRAILIEKWKNTNGIDLIMIRFDYFVSSDLNTTTVTEAPWVSGKLRVPRWDLFELSCSNFVIFQIGLCQFETNSGPYKDDPPVRRSSCNLKEMHRVIKYENMIFFNARMKRIIYIFHTIVEI